MTDTSLVLPEGIHQLAGHYRTTVEQSLKSAGLEHDYISPFHVEPRGSSFLVGFIVGLVSGQEIFIYVEPDSRRMASPDEKSGVSPGQNLLVWQFPSDPKLDSLASVVTTESLGVLFTRLKLGWVPSSVELLTYRPGRRAMVRCTGGPATVFVKAVRPSSTDRVVGSSRLAHGAGLPAPQVIGWSPAGIAVYETATGLELSRAYERKLSGKTAIGAAIETLFSLEKVTTSVPSKAPIITNFSWYFEKAIRAHPAEQDVLTNLEAKIRAAKFKTVRPEDTQTIHGDLHLGQIFVNDDAGHSVSGVIDLDDMGMGLFGDDIAGLWSNCVASTHLQTVENARSFWQECVEALGGLVLPRQTDVKRLHSSIAVHLVAQTLSTRGLHPEVAHNLIDEAAAHVS
jgi:streptomycin 6-kinase